MRKSHVSRVLLAGVMFAGLVACGQDKKATSGLFQQELKLEAPVPELKVDQSIKIRVAVRNLSGVTWPAFGEKPVRLSYHWLDKAGQVVVYDGERTLLEKDLPAGATAKLDAVVKAPGKPGEYTLQLTMVQENVAWFIDKGTRGLDAPIRVVKKQ
jgi:hypothetical protein